FLAIDMKRDLPEILGDAIVAAVDPNDRGSLVLALKPRDPTSTRRLLGRLDGLARAAEVYRASSGETGIVTSFALPRLAPVVPSYAFTGESLVVSGSPATLSSGHASHGDRTPGIGAALGRRPAHLAIVAEGGTATAWMTRTAGLPE